MITKTTSPRFPTLPKKKRVLVVGSLAESLVNFRGDLLQQMVADGHEVLTAAPVGPAWVGAALASWGVQHRTLPLSRTGTSVAADLRLLLALHALCRQERPDVVLSYTIKPVVYASLAARWAGVPRIAAMITGLGFTFMAARTSRQSLVQGVARTLYRLALRSAHVALFQNPDDEAEFMALGLLPAALDRRRIAGSGVNVERFAAQPLSAGPRRFLLVARLLRDKGVLEYFEAAALVKASRPTAEFHLVGPFDSNPSAVTRAELAAAVASGAVTYHGATDDVRPFLRDCHVYVLPSYREGMPRSVLEALATGRPVITTDAPGCRETVVAESNGHLVPVADATALAAAMERYVDLDLATLAAQGAASRRMAEAKYDVRHVNSDILQALHLSAPSRP